MFAPFFFHSFPVFLVFQNNQFSRKLRKIKRDKPKNKLASFLFSSPKNIYTGSISRRQLEISTACLFPSFFCREKKSFSLSLSSSSFCHLQLTAGEYKDDPDKQIGRQTFSPAHPNERKRGAKKKFFKKKKSRSGNRRVVDRWADQGRDCCVCRAVQYFFLLLPACFHILLRFLNEGSRYDHRSSLCARGKRPLNEPLVMK